MPLYDYQCKQCSQVDEVRHGFRETYEGRCSACSGEMARKFTAAPIIFNGSGFYVTDSRSGGEKKGGEAKSEGSSSSSKPSSNTGSSSAA